MITLSFGLCNLYFAGTGNSTCLDIHMGSKPNTRNTAYCGCAGLKKFCNYLFFEANQYLAAVDEEPMDDRNFSRRACCWKCFLSNLQCSGPVNNVLYEYLLRWKPCVVCHRLIGKTKLKYCRMLFCRPIGIACSLASSSAM